MSNEEPKNEIVPVAQQDAHTPSGGSIYNSLQSFQDGQRIANALSSSTLVPQDYRGNVANTLVALEMAQRTGSSPMTVMQNMHVIHGRPSWSSQFVIAALNSCGMFSPIRFRVAGEGDQKGCIAWAYDKATGDELEGPEVTIKMAKDEGWYGKNGSKWKTMPDLMLRYRAAKFFGNLYAPHILMGMHSADEIEDIGAQERKPPKERDITNYASATKESKLGKKVAEKPAKKTTEPEPDQPDDGQPPGDQTEAGDDSDLF